MPETLIAFAILVGLGLGVWLLNRRLAGREERRRAKSAAAASAAAHFRLKPAEQEHADAIHEIVQEARTGDLPKIVDRPKLPTVRETVRRYRRKPSHSAKRLPKTRPADPLTGRLPRELEAPVMLPGPPPSFVLESFTQDVWKAAQKIRSGGTR